MSEPITITELQGGELALAPELDALLTLDEAAAWLRMRPRDLSKRSKGKNPSIPGIWINDRVVRFHPRAVLAKAAADAGLTPQTIAAMFESNPTVTTTCTPHH